MKNIKSILVKIICCFLTLPVLLFSTGCDMLYVIIPELCPHEWELTKVLENLTKHFPKVHILTDCYTTFAAKASKYKNPINDVGVTQVYGMDDPLVLENGTGLTFVKEHEMTLASLIDELKGVEKSIFKKVFAGGVSKKMYRLYEYVK